MSGLPPKAAHERLLPRAESAARQLIYSWIEHGPKQRNHFDPDSFPTGPLQEVADGVLQALLHENVKDLAGLVAYFEGAPDGTRAELIECADSFAPMPSDCGPLLNILHQYHRANRLELTSRKLQLALASGDPTEDIIRELAEIEAGAIGELSSMIVRGMNAYPTEIPIEEVILGKSFIRKGDIFNLVSGAGMGKSVVGFQCAIAWALGLPYFGISPPRPLRILIFSGEDDGATIGQCRDGFLEHSKAITGKQLTAEDLAPLDSMIRTEFIREHVGERFHSYLASLLRDEPADLVIVNPFLSYIGGEIVAKASEWLRAGLMPILQAHECAALILHHTPKLSKDSWDNMDDTYSAIGGGEVANVPRSILTLKPTPAKDLFVVTVSKRQTTGWKDADGNFTTSYFVKRSGDPERPAWIPVAHDEAADMIGEGKQSGRTAKSAKKCSTKDVVDELQAGPTQRQALMERLMGKCNCSDRTASDAIRQAEKDEAISSFDEKNPNGGNAIKWLRLPHHPNQ